MVAQQRHLPIFSLRTRQYISTDLFLHQTHRSHRHCSPTSRVASPNTHQYIPAGHAIRGSIAIAIEYLSLDSSLQRRRARLEQNAEIEGAGLDPEEILLPTWLSERQVRAEGDEEDSSVVRKRQRRRGRRQVWRGPHGVGRLGGAGRCLVSRRRDREGRTRRGSSSCTHARTHTVIYASSGSLLVVG